MKERAINFGPDGTLVGIWSEPLGQRSALPAVVLLNSGVVHRVGVFRLHVRLARALAAVGIPSLRFDLSGIGDSLNRSTSATLEELVQLDIDAALEVVRSQGMKRVVLVGLCSGARDALDAASRLSDLSGVVCIDLIADFRTWRYHAVHYGRRLVRRESWKNTMSGRNNVLRRLRAHFRTGGDREGHLTQAMLGLRPVTERAWLTDTLDQFLDRGGSALLVFTGGLAGNYNHEAQFREALPRTSRHPDLSVGYYGDSDHVFSDPEHQRSLIEQLTAWVKQLPSG